LKKLKILLRDYFNKQGDMIQFGSITSFHVPRQAITTSDHCNSGGGAVSRSKSIFAKLLGRRNRHL